MSRSMMSDFGARFASLREEGLYKNERVIASPQGPEIEASLPGTSSRQVINFCANNYLGLSNDPEIRAAAKRTIDTRGFGLSSVRFICGTQDIHRELETRLSTFLGTEETILYAAAFDANGGLFEPLLSEEDAIISDELNHASIIDGIRLCKARRFRYRHADLDSLREQLREASDARYRIIATDGVFSMDGDIAPLPGILELARRYDALVMVDDSHATGYIGDRGRGSAEHHGVIGEIDIITTTFGKALGGASGACTSGRAEIIEMLRQRSRPYLFSNSVAPAVVGATLKALELVAERPELIETVKRNAVTFRERLRARGFDLVTGDTAIVPVMLYKEPLAVRMADMLYERGVYVIGFAFPVVPKGKARIRVQLSASHTAAHIDHAVHAFSEVGETLGVV